MQSKSVWVAICGDIRYELEVYAVIYKLLKMRSCGTIDGIILSTWEGSICNIDGLKELICNSNIILVETPKLEESIGIYSHVGYMRQAIQLKRALDIIPDDVFVLKCRTDFSISDITMLEKQLELQVPVSNDLFGVDLKYHIVVNELSLSLPFMFKDLAFYGYKSDIEKTICFDLTILSIGQKFMADFSFFLFPFINNNVFLKDFYSKISYSNLKFVMERLNLEALETMPKIILDFFSIYFCIIDSYFICNPSFIVRELNVDRMFAGDGHSVCVTRWHKAIRSSNVINNIVNGNAIKTDFLVKIRNRTSDVVNLSTKKLTEEEVDEVAHWSKKNFDINICNKNIRCMTKIQEPTPLSEFIKAIIIRHPDTSKEEIVDIFETIVNSDSFHKALVTVSNKNLSKSFDHMLLQTMPRYIGWCDQLLLYYSKRLVKNELKGEDLVIFDSFIKKYSNSGRHLFANPNPTKIAANYNIAKYYKNQNDNRFAEMYIEFLSKELPFIERGLQIDSFIKKINMIANDENSSDVTRKMCVEIIKELNI